MNRRTSLRLAAAASLLSLALPFSAGAYPDKPIRLVVSFPPGSGADTTARYVAQKLGERLGKPVVVENRPGANSFIAAQAVAGADPDGHTIFLASNSPMATNVAIFKRLPYDPVKDFAPVARLTRGVMAVVVPASSGAITIGELAERSRAQPGTLNYGAGAASYQIATELFLHLAGGRATPVPYKGVAPALSDLAGGQLDFAFADLGAVVPFLQSGKVRMLAVSADRRVDAFPKVPTLQESGFRDYYMINWTAAFVPARTPAPIANLLGEHLQAIYRLPEGVAKVRQSYGEPFFGDANELRRFQIEEISRWEQAARQAGMQKQ
ncbi:extra-cytoplasmic solute receptor BugT (plasmid) [Cupriavidus necator N-1]|uniref:Extra-cytoplasmic solute receptor BugT n=1 Tax=Cupriavidus necator (strain ATCC 43291 / DSM 13513 / CCUG 52238 / LMG 8453 / N-1) TaxID=1042878 RepID=F8GVV1_CUPNN|nr:tripartite tricarboxylate transporter substrate binding protein [Cupriavidus necator]AEI81593.1 extra-cytoplasmic solute receptor BugT [Cupriavidus necator N-1]MDX6007963.1 tripartite tricarboxylate transporter substrate binding protein [Cupriavidus necator]